MVLEYDFHRNFVHTVFQVVGTPTRVQIPVVGRTTGGSFRTFVFTRNAENAQGDKWGFRYFFDPESATVHVENTVNALLEDGDRITLTGRFIP
ncbi:MAG: hypothetical protein RIF32_08405 [Leptospirales bacterium]|jgi:hypothetical protein